MIKDGSWIVVCPLPQCVGLFLLLVLMAGGGGKNFASLVVFPFLPSLWIKSHLCSPPDRSVRFNCLKRPQLVTITIFVVWWEMMITYHTCKAKLVPLQKEDGLSDRLGGALYEYARISVTHNRRFSKIRKVRTGPEWIRTVGLVRTGPDRSGSGRMGPDGSGWVPRCNSSIINYIFYFFIK